MAQLQEAGFDMTEQAIGNMARFAKDDNLFVRFYSHPKQDAVKSAEEGRPIFHDTEYVSIMVPGDKTSIIERPASDQDRQRFAKHYAAFKSNESEVLDGTPLEAWPGLTRSQVEELRYFNIRTVEQLASVSDTHAQKFLGINMLRRKAEAYIEAAAGNAATDKMAAELEKRDNEITALKQAVEELQAMATKSKRKSKES